MYRIMVVEDEESIGKIICEALEKEGFTCHRTVEFDQIIDEFVRFSPELVLMDINLPGNDGFYCIVILFLAFFLYLSLDFVRGKKYQKRLEQLLGNEEKCRKSVIDF